MSNSSPLSKLLGCASKPAGPVPVDLKATLAEAINGEVFMTIMNHADRMTLDKVIEDQQTSGSRWYIRYSDAIVKTICMLAITNADGSKFFTDIVDDADPLKLHDGGKPALLMSAEQAFAQVHPDVTARMWAQAMRLNGYFPPETDLVKNLLGTTESSGSSDSAVSSVVPDENFLTESDEMNTEVKSSGGELTTPSNPGDANPSNLPESSPVEKIA